MWRHSDEKNYDLSCRVVGSDGRFSDDSRAGRGAIVNPRLGFGDYDEAHQWHDAGWWWANHPDWVRKHHPTWWGDYDDGHVWRPAAWWWQNNPDWVRHHHPEWWGDWDDQPCLAAGGLVVGTIGPIGFCRHHPEWWGAAYQGVWYPASWWVANFPDWVRIYHPEWWGAPYQGVWYPASWWAAISPIISCRIIPNGGATTTATGSGIRPVIIMRIVRMGGRESSRLVG